MDAIVIGAGAAGCVVARKMADSGKKVLVLEQREHIGGNCFDEYDEQGILVHKYGPHIFHTNEKKVYDYLSEYTEWYDYQHKVIGNIYGTKIPVPFNLNSLYIVYPQEKAKRLEEKLVSTYGAGSRVPILKLQQSEEEEIREVAQYVYENIFLKYTMKQWGQKPEEVDASVTARVPVLLSRDDRYFQDIYQGMPAEGYHKMFSNMLQHENIEILLGIKAEDKIKLVPEDGVYFEGEKFDGEVIYTGEIDRLFQYCYGELPYRSLRFSFEYHEKEYYQEAGVVNYTVTEDYTRITEFKYLTGQNHKGTTIIKEYPLEYKRECGMIPYYAILNPENEELYQKYHELAEQFPNMYLIGRLAEYKYYNIDAIVLRALLLAEQICSKK